MLCGRCMHCDGVKRVFLDGERAEAENARTGTQDRKPIAANTQIFALNVFP